MKHALGLFANPLYSLIEEIRPWILRWEVENPHDSSVLCDSDDMEDELCGLETGLERLSVWSCSRCSANLKDVEMKWSLLRVCMCWGEWCDLRGRVSLSCGS